MCTPSPIPPGKRIAIEYQRRRHPVVDIAALAGSAVLPSMHNTMEFILALNAASLDGPVAKLSQDALERLRDPPGHLIPIEDQGTHFSILTYLALENSSQVAYNRVCNAARKEFFDSRGIDTLLSFHNVEKVIASHTGVVFVEHDMCRNSCIAYTGPFSHLETCPTCGTSCWQE